MKRRLSFSTIFPSSPLFLSLGQRNDINQEKQRWEERKKEYDRKKERKKGQLEVGMNREAQSSRITFLLLPHVLLSLCTSYLLHAYKLPSRSIKANRREEK